MTTDTQEVRWFNGRNCVGVVRVIDPYDGPKYYIGVGLGYNEEDDIRAIAEWGTHFPNHAGDALFGTPQ